MRIVLTTVIEMVEILVERVGKCSVERVRYVTRKMVPIPRRVSLCLALALSILLSSLDYLSSALSCVFSHPNPYFSERIKIKNELLRVIV